MKETVIQFGEGNFLRGFFDYFLDVMNKDSLYEGKAVVVQPRKGGKCALLENQDCKYNLFMRGIENGETVEVHRLIESISRAIDPYRDFEGYMALAENPDFRFVVSNTTEAGIAFDSTCRFDDKPCSSFPGKLTQLLYRRYENKLPGFVFLPCELIDNNGDELKMCIIKYAEAWQLPSDFIEWISSENVFLNTLVDRIVTGYPSDGTEKLYPEDKFLDTSEIFHLWVIEGNYENELPLKRAGFNVIWTDCVKPYKKIKVRILNGAHTSLVAASLLSDVETVGETMKDGLLSSYLDAVMRTEILPVIGENEDSRKFADSVFDRFRNPFIQHKWRSIALNSISKYSVRVLPTILEYKEKNGDFPKLLPLSLAALIYFYKNDTPEDSAEAIQLVKNESISSILSNSTLWGADISAMTGIVSAYYCKIEELGMRELVKWIMSE